MKPRPSKKSWSTMMAPVDTMASTMLCVTMSYTTFLSPALKSEPARQRMTEQSRSASMES